MDANSCINYPVCVEWTTEIPYDFVPRYNFVILEGIECNFELKTKNEVYDLDIVLKNGEEEKVLHVTTFIRDSFGKPNLIAFCKPSCIFRGRKILWSQSRSEILEKIPNIFKTGKLTIVCIFHTANTHLGKTHVSTQTTLNSVDLQSLSRDISTILNDKTFSDVKLKCGGCTFSANRSVLAARSEVFAAMFRNKMAETEAGEVDIKDIDTEVLELLLKYVYSAEIPDLCEETAHRLYEAADKYAVHGLRRACSDWMVKCQTTDNCLDLFVLADKHSDENFKEAVACFVAEHLPDLSVESWSTFRNNYPQLVLLVLEKRSEDSTPGAAKRAKTDLQ